MSDVIVIGAGLSGLSCALTLHEQGVDVTVVEKSERIGGRVWTDEVDGFLLDRGFQVLLTAYPTAALMLDYEELDLRKFKSGAVIHRDGSFHRLIDPLRNPSEAFASLMAPVGSLSDKMKMLKLRNRVTGETLAELFSRPEITTLDALQNRWGFSDDMISGFFRPFIGGVTLDRQLRTSSRFFEFVMRMFASGDVAVPASGMSAIPRQLASRIPTNQILLNSPVNRIEPDGAVTLQSGARMQARSVVIATDGPAAHELHRDIAEVPSVAVTCIYFAADEAPISEPVLILNGETGGIVNNVVVMSQVSSSYAPSGKELVSVTVLDDALGDNADIETAVREELSDWFGPAVRNWTTIQIDRVLNALPLHSPPALNPPERDVQIGLGLFVCGDHQATASIEGAMASGLHTADAILKQL